MTAATTQAQAVVKGTVVVARPSHRADRRRRPLHRRRDRQGPGGDGRALWPQRAGGGRRPHAQHLQDRRARRRPQGRRVRRRRDPARVALPRGVTPVAVGAGAATATPSRATARRASAARSAHSARRGWSRTARSRWSIPAARARSAPAPASAIPAGRCCAARRWSASSRRAAHPHPRIACGHLTRWAPVVASGDAGATPPAAVVAEASAKSEPRRRGKRRAVGRRTQVVAASSPAWIGRVD